MTLFKRNSFGQKFIGLLLTATMLTPIQSFADYRVFYQAVEKTDLSSGVVYEQHLKLTTGGWVNLNVMRVDLTNPNIDIKPLYPETATSKREKLSKLASKEKNLIGAINADFFEPKLNTPFGSVIDNGKMVILGSSSSKYASLNIDKTNSAFVEYITGTGYELSNPKATLKIDFKNKPYYNYSFANIYDRSWGPKSIGRISGKRVAEMVIVDNTVMQISENGDPLDIPANGYVVTGIETKATTIMNNFAVGDYVFLDNKSNLSNLDFSIGGGSQIVKEGKAMTTYTVAINGKQPRTAVGITKDRKQLIFLTVDGRTSNFRGLDMKELSALMVELGSYEAICMDGGGSTEMLVKALGQTSAGIVNTPSDGGERSIKNGIGIISTSESGALDQLMIKSASDKVLVNSPTSLNLIGLDANRNTVTIDPAQIAWSVTANKGGVKNNQLTASAVGKLTVTAKYGNLTATKDFVAYNDIVDIDFLPKVVQLRANGTLKAKLTGSTTSGYTLPLSPTSVIWSIPSNLFKVAPDGTITANGKPGKGVLTLTLGNIKKHIPVIVGADITVVENFDSGENGVPARGTTTAYPAGVKSMYTHISGSLDGTNAVQLAYDFPALEATRAAYINFAPNELVLNTLPDKLGLDVFGTQGNNHWLRAKVTDSKGTVATVDFATAVNWTGWKNVEANLPKTLIAPITINQIYLAETEAVKIDSGSILMDNLTAVVEKQNDIVLPKDVNKLPKMEDMKIKTSGGTQVAIYGEFSGAEALGNPENYKAIAAALNKYKYTYFAGTADSTMSNLLKSDIQATTYNEMFVGQTAIVTLKSVNDSFIKADPTQLEKLMKRIKNFRYKNLVIVTNHTMNFTDPLEEELFTSQLETLNRAGVKTYVLSGGQSNGYNIRLTNSATVIDVQTLNKYSSFDLSKGSAILAMNITGNKVEFEVKALNFIVKKPLTDKRVKAPSTLKFKTIRPASISK